MRVSQSKGINLELIVVKASILIWTLLIIMIPAASTLPAKSRSITFARVNFTCSAMSATLEFLVSFTTKFSAEIGKRVILRATVFVVRASTRIWTLLVIMILAASTLHAKSYSITCARGNFFWGAMITTFEFLVSFTAKFSVLIGKGVIQRATV